MLRRMDLALPELERVLVHQEQKVSLEKSKPATVFFFGWWRCAAGAARRAWRGGRCAFGVAHRAQRAQIWGWILFWKTWGWEYLFVTPRRGVFSLESTAFFSKSRFLF